MNASIRTLAFSCLFLLFLIPLASLAIEEDNGNDEAAEAAEAVEAMEAVEDEEAAELIDEPVDEDALDGEDVEAEPQAVDTDVETGPESEQESGAVAETEPESEQEAESVAEAEPESEQEAERVAETDPATDSEPAAAAAPETFILQGHPVFTPDQAELVYRPLVNYLNDVTPYRFDLQISRDFHRYSLDVRRGGTPDLVLEEAHMTAYRMQRDGYRPLVKAADPSTYSLMASPSYTDGTLRDFVGQPVSSMPSPSLGYLVLSRWYENPMQQPIIQSNASSWLDAIEIVFSMEAEAAIAPRNLSERYVNLEIIETSEEFPGLTLSASAAVPDEIQDEIRRALLQLHEDDNHYAVVHELDIERFVDAEPEEYEGLDSWLREVTGFF